jgi:hypothetical protein
MSSIPMVGVPLRTKVIAMRPSLCSELNFLRIVTFCAAWPQTITKSLQIIYVNLESTVHLCTKKKPVCVKMKLSI